MDINKFKEKYDLLVEDVNKFIEYSNDDGRIKKEKVDSIATYENNFKTYIMEIKATATNILISAQQDKKSGSSSLKNSYEDGGKSRTVEYYSKKIKDALLEYSKQQKSNK